MDARGAHPARALRSSSRAPISAQLRPILAPPNCAHSDPRRGLRSGRFAPPLGSGAMAAPASAASERDAARAALTQLEYEREASARPVELGALPALPAYLRAGPPAPADPVPPGDALHHGGGAPADAVGLTPGSALDCGATFAVMPGDRIATTVLFPSAAGGDSVEARRQRALHKQNEILQGLHAGQKDS